MKETEEEGKEIVRTKGPKIWAMKEDTQPDPELEQEEGERCEEWS